MWARISALFRAGFDAQWRSGSWPAAPLVVHGTVSAVLCGLVSNELPPFAYGVFALSISAALIALPLLGEFGALLRSDPASEWIEAQPVRKSELRIARIAVLAVLLAALSLSALLPAALLAPREVGLLGRAALVAGGLGQALFAAAALLGLQSTLGERAEGLLVLLQTVLVVLVVAGVVSGLRWVPHLVGLEAPSDALAAYPPSWFAHPLAPRSAGALWTAAAPMAVGAAIAVLALAPLPPARLVRRSDGWLGRLLQPVRAVATRWWVRSQEERAAFELVCDALPLEREFVLRTYPMIGIPLAFLAVGARGDDDLLALLLFTPATYFPVLLVQVQATASPEARWILDTAPVDRAQIASGAIKALAVRFLLPLYLALGGLCWTLADLDLALRLVPPGACLSWILLRRLYARMVAEPPLSIAPDAVRAELDWTGMLIALGMGLTVLALIAIRYIATPIEGALAALALLFADRLFDRIRK